MAAQISDFTHANVVNLGRKPGQGSGKAIAQKAGVNTRAVQRHAALDRRIL